MRGNDLRRRRFAIVDYENRNYNPQIHLYNLLEYQMKVKLLVSMAGPTAAHNAVDEIDVDDATANQRQLL